MPKKDANYVLDLCDSLLSQISIREHRFPFLVGDTGRMLPVDAYYPKLKLVVEYHERQHTEAVDFFDKPDKLTVSGVPRGEQRKKYDQRRRDVLPKHGLVLVELSVTDFPCDSQEWLRRAPEIICSVLKASLELFVKAD